jgi:hypothetical protein
MGVALGAASFGVLAAGVVGAQNSDPFLVTGLNNPRQIVFYEGSLYIAEAGTGGPLAVDSPLGPGTAGGTAQITRVDADGTRTVVAAGLPSRNTGGEVVGASAIAFQRGAEDGGAEGSETLMWISTAQGALELPFTFLVLALDSDNRIVHSIDVYANEAAQNPDGNEIDSNAVDLAWDAANERLFIADAGANALWVWNGEMDGMDSGSTLQPFAVWTDNRVPTSVEIGPDGSVWVGFLTGFPFPEGGAVVEQYDAEGTLIETYTGFTTIVDLLFANDTVYAVSIGTFSLEAGGWQPGTGTVRDVLSGSTYADGLTLPYGLDANDDGVLYVVSNSAYLGAGTGVVTPLELAAQYGGVLAEATPDMTPEATEMMTPEAMPPAAEPTPDVTPETTPETTPDMTPEATDDASPEETPPAAEPTLDATPEVTPGT